MNGEQEYAATKSPMTVALWILLVLALAWAIIASTMATRRGGELTVAKHNFEQLRQEYDQALINMQAREADIERKIQAAEELRKVAMDWKAQYMSKLEALNKAKAAPAPTAKSATKSSTSSKSSSSKSKSKSGSKSTKH
jgi:hypothetical protein